MGKEKYILGDDDLENVNGGEYDKNDSNKYHCDYCGVPTNIGAKTMLAASENGKTYLFCYQKNCRELWLQAHPNGKKGYEYQNRFENAKTR